MDPTLFFQVLYPLQDRVLRLVNGLDTGLYLSGGTAAARGYLEHRFADDLDLFANDHRDFALWVERVVQALARDPSWRIEVLQRDERCARVSLVAEGQALRIEMVNDVPAHLGEIREHALLGRLDSAENILAHTISALVDRDEPNDLADIWGFAARLQLPLSAALEDRRSKAAGIFPPDLARLLCTASADDWKVVRWIAAPEAPEVNRYLADLAVLGNRLIAP